MAIINFYLFPGTKLLYGFLYNHHFYFNTIINR